MQKQTIALLVIVLAILGVVYIMGVANLQTPSTGFNVIDAIKSVFRGAPSCTTGYKCYSATVLGYQNRKCKWSNLRACPNGCLNNACVPSATCKEIFSCSGTILIHQLTNCTNLTQNCPFGCANNACKPDPCIGVSCLDVCQDANNLKTNGNCVAGACQYTTSSCTYGCNTTANNKCNLPPAPQCTIDSQCGSVTCSGSTLTTPKCSSGACTTQTSSCTYGCNTTTNNKCNAAPSLSTKTLLVYDDTFQNGFAYNDWQNPAGTPCFISSSYSSQKASGQYSLASNLNNFCTLFLYTDTIFNVDDYSDVEFDVYGIAPSQTAFGIELATAAYSSTGAQILIGSYVAVSQTWKHAKIPLKDFNVALGTRVAGLKFRDDSGSSGNGNVLFDNIKFVKLADNGTSQCITYYLDSVAGNDANAGTSESLAWKTLAKANTVNLLPGDSLLLKRGSVWTGPLKAKWNGTASNPILISAYGTGNLPHIHNTDSTGEVVQITGSYQIIENLEVSNNPPPADSGCIFNGKPTPVGWRVGFALKSSSSYNTIRNSKSYNHTAGIHIASGSNHNKILNNELVKNTYMSVLTVGGDDDGGAAGIILNGDDNEIAYNYFADNNACTYDYGPDGISIEVFKAHNNIIHHNRAFNDLSFAEHGGDASRKTEDTTIAYNLYVNTMAEGGNFVNVRGSGQAWGPTLRTKVYNNVAYITSTTGSQGVICSAGCDSSILNLKNNIIVSNWKGIYADAPFDEGYNIIWNTTHTWFQTQGNWTLSPTSKKTDPKFVNPAANDFHLQSTSPAINAGTNVGYTSDLDGVAVPQGNAPDMGAYEFVPSTPSCTIDAQCGSVTCSGNSLITPKCTGGICTNQSSVCTYGCANNACNSAPSNASKIEIGVDAYTEHIATEPSKLTYVYKYVVGQGWQSYVTSYIAEAYKYNFKPVIVFYTNFDTGNPDFVAWDQVMNAIKTDGRQVWVVVEPDMWGYIRNDGTCGSVGKQHVTRFLSTKPSNAHLGFFISPWNLPYNGATYDANDWYNCWTAAGGNQMEDIYVDVSDRDQETYGTYPWASSKITLYEDWFKALNADTGRKMSVWQIPMGNSQCLNGKRSNLVETWLTPSKLTALSPYVNRLLFGPGDEGNAGDPQSWNIQNYAKYDCGYFNQRVAAVG